MPPQPKKTPGSGFSKRVRAIFRISASIKSKRGRVREGRERKTLTIARTMKYNEKNQRPQRKGGGRAVIDKDIPVLKREICRVPAGRAKREKRKEISQKKGEKRMFPAD